MTEVELIEQTAAEWHALTRCGHVSWVTAVQADLAGFLDGYQGKPWRRGRSKGRWAHLRKRIWWEAGWLARWMGRDAKGEAAP